MPAERPKNHEHSLSHGTFVYGRKLGNGDIIQKDDVYNSTSGRWEKCPCPGVTLYGLEEDSPVTWIRPMNQFDADEVVV